MTKEWYSMRHDALIARFTPLMVIYIKVHGFLELCMIFFDLSLVFSMLGGTPRIVASFPQICSYFLTYIGHMRSSSFHFFFQFHTYFRSILQSDFILASLVELMVLFLCWSELSGSMWDARYQEHWPIILKNVMLLCFPSVVIPLRQ